MRENVWTNTKTNTEISITGPLGSPGAWLRRAYNVANLDDTAFKLGSLTPTEISVAGIWYRPATLPDTENYRTLFRFFKLASPEQLQRRAKSQEFSAIGIAMAVPFYQVLQCQRQFCESGATYVWWNTPVDKSLRADRQSAAKAARRHLDHAVVYSLLDSGMTVTEIAHQLEFPRENIHYVGKKWSAGLPVLQQIKPKIDAASVLADHAAGATATDLAVTYKTTPAYVYKLLHQQKHKQCLDPSPP